MNFIKEILRGVLIGIANAIPGVSGGTMMVSMGIYDKVISSVTNLFRQFKKSVITLFPYLVGMAIGIVGLAFSIEYLFETFPLQTALLFIGLILGGLPMLFGRLKGKKLGIANAGIFIIFFLLIIGLEFLNGSGGKEAVLTVSAVQVMKLFGIGVLASATMVIPGVSGSMILMLLGYYNPIIETITGFIKSLLAFDINGILTACGILVPFGIGVVLGIFAIAKIIEILLQKQEGLTYSAILGLVMASPVVILMQNPLPDLGITVILTGILALALGFFVAFFLGRE